MDESLTLQLSDIRQDFQDLYKDYYQAILGFITSYVKLTDVAEDITQDLFLNLVERENQEITINNIEAYLFTSAKNRALNYLRKLSKEEQLRETLYREYDNLQRSIEEDITDLEYQKLFNYYLEKLTTQNGAVFKLCRVEGKTYREAAKVLGITQSAVKKNMVKAMKVLKELLRKDLGPLILIITRLYTNLF
ncbi:RNA polymerase sigma-70 factor [Pedobacter glucosidilyticus]|uniref:RNA polymerase sigma-70 factor n=1 Tax=Pedobacter glucosidilyticus TaxID=1122941 RepID=UPI0004196F30|nr:RNA polymerase sigma-70 factor [Pedobacter glucosidilyticus]